MEVLAHLSPPLLAQLRAALRREHNVVVADNWNSLISIVRQQPIDVAVVEPKTEGVTRTPEIRALLLMYPSLPVVLYTSLVPETVRITAELSPLGLHHVVLRSFEDDAVKLRGLLERMVVYGVAEVLLEPLIERLAGGPPLLARAVARLFREPHAFVSVNDLAGAASLTRRSLDRWLARQGVQSGRTLVAVARLARAYHHLRDPGCMAEDVARKLGYASARSFARHMRNVIGLTPTALRQDLSPEEVTTRLTVLLWGHPENGNDIRSGKTHTGRR